MSSERTVSRGRAIAGSTSGLSKIRTRPPVEPPPLPDARLAVDAQRALDLTIDQVAHRETHVGLEAAECRPA